MRMLIDGTAKEVSITEQAKEIMPAPVSEETNADNAVEEETPKARKSKKK